MKVLWSEVWKGGFQLMQILGLIGMYFDTVVVEVKKNLLLFRLALAILCTWMKCNTYFPTRLVRTHPVCSSLFLLKGNALLKGPKYSGPKIAHHLNLSPSLDWTITEWSRIVKNLYFYSPRSICNTWFSIRAKSQYVSRVVKYNKKSF